MVSQQQGGSAAMCTSVCRLSECSAQDLPVVCLSVPTILRQVPACMHACTSPRYRPSKAASHPGARWRRQSRDPAALPQPPPPAQDGRWHSSGCARAPAAAAAAGFGGLLPLLAPAWPGPRRALGGGRGGGAATCSRCWPAGRNCCLGRDAAAEGPWGAGAPLGRSRPYAPVAWRLAGSPRVASWLLRN